MVRLEKFNIEFSNPERAYFAGQEVSGKIIIETSEDKKVNEILLEIKGRAKTYWTKHSGKSRKHCSTNEPYFCEQFNTRYTHRIGSSTTTTTTIDEEKNFGEKKPKERILKAGHHEIPFSYTLPKSLPSSFEGEFGFIRYTARAICERPWDFDIVSRTAFTVVGIEDINQINNIDETTSLECSTSTDAPQTHFWCIGQGSVHAEMQIDKHKNGYTPGETICVNAKIQNNSRRRFRSSNLILYQHVLYKAKTFAGDELIKKARKVVSKIERDEIKPNSEFEYVNAQLLIPSIPPRLSQCKIIDLSYTIDLEVHEKLRLSLPILIGSIPRVSDVVAKLIQLHNARGSETVENGDFLASSTSLITSNREDEAIIKVTVTDEHGIRRIPAQEANTNETDTLLSMSKKRVRMPSSILSELYPALPSPYYRESCYGRVNISDEKERCQYGENLFAPKYPFYTD